MATIYTSIPGELKRRTRQDENYGAVYQRECIASWRKAGLRVVSVNSDSELAVLRLKGFEVEYVSNGTLDGRTTIGRILSLIRASGDEAGVILNADCFILNPGQAVDTVLEAAKDSLVTLERIGIDPETMRPTRLLCGGFDGFVFDARFLADVKDADNWSIGSPQWDYWFPAVMHLAGAKLKRPDALLLLHLNHAQKWDLAEYMANAAKLLRALSAMDLQRFPPGLAAQIHEFGRTNNAEDAAVDSLLNTLASWLVESRELFPLGAPGARGDFVRRILAGLESEMTFG